MALTREQIIKLLEATDALLDQLEAKKPMGSSVGCCGSAETTSEDKSTPISPLEELITNQINKHIENGTFPTLDEAQTIHILDQINSKYN